MEISGLSGNEIYCLALKGFEPGEIVVGNSVFSLGIGGWFNTMGGMLAGGEVAEVTSLISEGRHAALERMENEARKQFARGITGVITAVSALGGYTEFLAQGTAVSVESNEGGLFSTSASGIDLYCHLDAGYTPKGFVMGNVAYSLGLGRGISSSFRRLVRGEVIELSQMYNEIRHLALDRIRREARSKGANAVVDLCVETLYHHSTGTHELIITGTASHYDRIPSFPLEVITSELTGEELWNMAKQEYVPMSLVTANSVCALGVAQSIGTSFQAMGRGELPNLTTLIYEARENCLDRLRSEAERVGADRVIGNKLIIAELQPGLLEILAIGTAVRKMEGTSPLTPELIPQAVITDRETFFPGGRLTPDAERFAVGVVPTTRRALGWLLFLVFACGYGIAVLYYNH